MSIIEQVQNDLSTAMKARDKKKVSALRTILSQLRLSKKDATGEFGEKEELAVLAAEKKRRQQAADAFHPGGREDKAADEEEEARIIEGYMPRALDEEELTGIIDAVVADTGAVSIRDMGKVMSQVMSQTAGRADGKMVSDMVKKKLSG